MKKVYPVKIPKGTYVFSVHNESPEATLEIVTVLITGENVKLLSLQIGADEFYRTTSKMVLWNTYQMIWYPFLEFFIQMESPKEQHIEILIETVIAAKELPEGEE